VVRQQVYERLGGFDARLAWTEDWEMWARVAAHYPVWFEPEPLALYRIHSVSSSGRLTRTAETIRDTRRAIDLIQDHVPPARAKVLAREAHHTLAVTALRRARRLIGSGDVAAGAAHLREAVRSDASLDVLARSAFVLTLLLRSNARHLLGR
jgi:hypothetical protein